MADFIRVVTAELGPEEYGCAPYVQAYFLTCDGVGKQLQNPNSMGSWGARTGEKPVLECSLNDLYVRATVCRDNEFHDEVTYDTHIEYVRPYSVNLYDAELMFKTLKHINKVLNAQSIKLGPALTFGQVVARVAIAVGAEQYIERYGGSRGSMYSENTYGLHPLGDVVRAADRLAEEWHNANPDRGRSDVA